jgi:hypothetical protein
MYLGKSYVNRISAVCKKFRMPGFKYFYESDQSLGPRFQAKRFLTRDDEVWQEDLWKEFQSLPLSIGIRSTEV